MTSTDSREGSEGLIGRERELEVLEGAMLEAAAGRGSLVLLAGDAGAGKTSLAAELTAGSDAIAMRGAASEAGTPPHGPVVEALRSRDAKEASAWMTRHVQDFRRGYELAGISLDSRAATSADHGSP